MADKETINDENEEGDQERNNEKQRVAEAREGAMKEYENQSRV